MSTSHDLRTSASLTAAAKAVPVIVPNALIAVSSSGRSRNIQTVMHALAQYVRQSRMAADTISETVF
jgi:hypothetical protein